MVSALSRTLSEFLCTRRVLENVIETRACERDNTKMHFDLHFRVVELTHHNANHLDLGSQRVEVAWTNHFYDPDVAARRSEALRQRHHLDTDFRKSSVEILKRSTEAKIWTEEGILEAIKEFHDREGRAPYYSEFRQNKELPDPSTLWRKFGSVEKAINSALEPGVRTRLDSTRRKKS